MTNNEVLLTGLLVVAVFELVRARRRAAAAGGARSSGPEYYTHDHLDPLLVELARAGASNVRREGGVIAIGDVGKWGGPIADQKAEEKYEIKLRPAPLYGSCWIAVCGQQIFFLDAPVDHAVRVALGFVSGLLGVHFANVNQAAKHGGLLIRELCSTAEAQAAKAGIKLERVTVGANFVFLNESQQLLTVDLGFGDRGSCHAEACAEGYRIGFCFEDEETRKLIPARHVRDAARRMFAEAAAEERAAQAESVHE